MKLLSVITYSILTLSFMASNAFALGSGFSGITASADSAETVVSNPAGMTRIKQPSLYGNMLVAYQYDRDKTTVKNTGQKQTSSDDTTVIVPSLYYVYPISDRWAVGIGPDAVSGLGGSFDDDWPGRYLIQDWSLSFIGIAPSVAYRIDDKLSVGFSVPIMYSRYTLQKAVFNLAPDSSDGSFDLKADGWGVGVNAGILYEFSDYTRVGLVYRSKVSAKDEGRPDFSGLTQQRHDLLDQVGALDKKISIKTSSPQIVHAGMFHDFRNKWTCTFDAFWVDFSDWGFEDVMIGDTRIDMQPGKYKDIYATTVGVSYELTPKITARSGAFYISSGQNDGDRRPSMRLDQIWGAGLGYEYSFRKNRSVSLDVTYVQLGDGKYSIKDVPVAGDIEGRYTCNNALVFSAGVKWGFGADR